MRIAIIDAEIVNKKQHRFPNLASMKLSAYYKSKGHDVTLIWDYFDLFSGYYEVLKKGVVNDIPHFMKNIIKRSETIDGKWYDRTVIRYYQKNDIKYDKIIISKVFTDTEVPQPNVVIIKQVLNIGLVKILKKKIFTISESHCV